MSSETKDELNQGGRRVRSIARSITWSYWWRRLVNWILLDLLVLFWEHNIASGAVYYGYRWLVLAVAIWELIDLIALALDVRRVRRKLQPLQDLALEADRFANLDLTSTDKIESLEQAIERANVDSPSVSTGDSDLRSIEVALNRLLRQMQEAKIQQMRFVSDASHELRTPIAVIQGYVNMLDRWGKSDEKVLNESVEALKAESEHMQELVDQLLFLARGDSGRNTLQKEEINLADLLEEVWEESCMIDENHVYQTSIPEGLSRQIFKLEGDTAMLKQAMRIIVANAQKYSASGTTIELGLAQDAESVSFYVRDEGIGISQQDANKVFDRFYRSNNARSEETDGSGLGLSIAKWIVDAHAGTIEVSSREGVGTRFTVRIPRTFA